LATSRWSVVTTGRRRPAPPASHYLSVERTITHLAKEAGILERFNLTPTPSATISPPVPEAHRRPGLTQDALGTPTRHHARVRQTTKRQHIEAHESLFDDADK